jgi:hypothetical protein
MPVSAALLAAVTLALAVAAARASARVAFTMLFATIVLVPAPLAVPTGGVTSELHVSRVVLLGVLVGVLWRHRNARVWRATPTALAFLVYLAVVLLTGIVFAPLVLDVGGQLSVYLGVVEQAIVLVVCTALVRTDPDALWFIRPVAGVLIVSAAIATVEHLTGSSWGHFLFQAAPAQQGIDAAAPLALRAGAARVRAGNEFPLGFAWVSAALLPLLVVLVVRRPRFRFPLLVLAGGIVVSTIYWSYTRSALVGVVASFVVLGLLARERRVSAVVIAVVALGVAAFVAAPSLSQHFSAAVDTGSIAVREQRLPIVLEAVAAHPWTGLGLTGLQSVGLQGVDATYLLAYGVTGAAGLAGLIGLLAVAAMSVGRGVLALDPRTRMVSAALTAGVVTLVAAGGAYDAMALNGTADVLWVLVAVGIVVAEREKGPVTLWAAPSLLPPVATFGALAGIAALLAAPTHHARQFEFSTLPIVQEAGFYDPNQPGDTLVNTVCGVAQAEADRLPDVSVDCRDPFTSPGLGILRIEAPSANGVAAAVAAIRAAVRSAGVRSLSAVPESAAVAGEPTLATTAPLWLPVVVVMLLFVWSGVVLRGVQRRAARRRPA